MLVDADGEEADDVLVDVRLALELGDRRRRGVDVEHDVMRLAVLGDAVGEGAKAPGLGLDDLPAIVVDDLGGVFRERVDLGLGQVLTREENMLVERHVHSLFWPIADGPRWHAPPAVVQKALGHSRRLRPIAAAYGRKGAEKARLPASSVEFRRVLLYMYSMEVAMLALRIDA